MKHYRLILATFAVMAFAGSAGYTFMLMRIRALEDRLHSAEMRLEAAETRATAANQSVFGFGTISANPPLLGAPVYAPYAAGSGNGAGSAGAANPEDRAAGLDERIRRVEGELEPHATLIGEISKK